MAFIKQVSCFRPCRHWANTHNLQAYHRVNFRDTLPLSPFDTTALYQVTQRAASISASGKPVGIAWPQARAPPWVDCRCAFLMRDLRKLLQQSEHCSKTESDGACKSLGTVPHIYSLTCVILYLPKSLHMIPGVDTEYRMSGHDWCSSGTVVY